MTDNEKNSPHIGTLNERSLHAALKDHLFQEGDQAEVRVENYVIDILRGETLIEIQTRSFGAMRRKLENLLPAHHIQLYYPIAAQKWIMRVGEHDQYVARRRSPRKGNPFDLFNELLSLRNIALHPNFELHLLLIEVEDVWKDDGKGSWRKKFWSVVDHRLLNVREEICLKTPQDYLDLLPAELPDPFTNAELMKAQHCTRRLAGKATYALREMDLIERVGTQDRYHVFQRKQTE